MKIMHLCTGFPISHNGGITNYVRSIANSQVDNGLDVVVVCGKEKEKCDFKFRYVEYSDFYVKPFTFRRNISFIAYKKIEKIIRNEKPDLIHIHMMLDVDERLYQILEKYKIKYIVSLHDYSFLCPRIQMFKEGANCEKVDCKKCSECATCLERMFILKKIATKIKIDITKGKKRSPQFLKIFENYKKLLENANILLPVSKKVEEIYINNGIKNNYQMLHIGNITANQFKEYSKKEYDREEKIKIVFLGTFSDIKGKNEFLKITKKLDHQKFSFYFLGRATEQDINIMRNNGIVNVGQYNQSDLKNILKEYDMGCVLSIWEDNAPQVVMELLNNNIPVIGTKMGGIPDFIQDSINGFLYYPYSTEEFELLINKLEKLNKEKVEIMKTKVRRTKTPNEHYNELEKIYKNIVEEGIENK